MDRNEMHIIASEVRAYVDKRIAELPSAPPGRDGRDGIAGPQGPAGLPGKDAAADLTTIVAAEVNRQMSEALKTVRSDGRAVKFLDSVIAVINAPIYKGVWTAGEYERGDMVTLDGSVWHANDKTTERPGNGSNVWTLCVKRGRDGKDASPVLPLPYRDR